MTNRMLYSRGSRHDYVTWAKDKEKTWEYSNILPYFLKSEDILIEEQKLSGKESLNEPRHYENQQFAYAPTNPQISFAVTAFISFFELSV